ncbi:hypothetical protein AZE42_00754 [Rhizopogon vesiculosus]|uniref:C2H2-type domain-containing protein n=1 Tax=Rhizopogon vesiculosus TaxID=180088 RepID=A0A1J8QXZ8_9AGAM|nr:hypothetical protein AZE42_00754 [Rhizopogon vesiculosus]
MPLSRADKKLYHYTTRRNFIDHTVLTPCTSFQVYPYILTSAIPVYMSLDIIDVDPETFVRVRQSDQPVIVYQCKLQGVPCGVFVEGNTTAIYAHLRRHGITGLDSDGISCTWGSCSKTFKRGNMIRHILAHLGVKVRCSVCGIVKCRRYLLNAHIMSSEQCHLAFVDVVHGPEGRFLVGTVDAATHQV